jgi:hypothetical protein
VTVDHCLYVGISLLGFLRSHILVLIICHIAILAIHANAILSVTFSGNGRMLTEQLSTDQRDTCGSI